MKKALTNERWNTRKAQVDAAEGKMYVYRLFLFVHVFNMAFCLFSYFSERTTKKEHSIDAKLCCDIELFIEKITTL